MRSEDWRSPVRPYLTETFVVPSFTASRLTHTLVPASVLLRDDCILPRYLGRRNGRRSQLVSKRIVAIIGVLLIAAGVAALVYGGFTYTEDTHSVDLGVAEVQLSEQEHVNIPVWAGVAAVAVGTLALVIGTRRR
jgi:hypothetical protein